MAAQIKSALAILERKQIIRRKQVEALVGLSRSSIYDRMLKKTFPSGIRIGPNSVGWRLSDIEAWLADPAGYHSDM